MGVYVSSVVILGGTGLEAVCSRDEFTGEFCSYLGVGVSSAPSKEGSRNWPVTGSGDGEPWLEGSTCFGDGGVYTFRGGNDVVEAEKGCGGAGLVTPIPFILISSMTDFLTSAVI